MLVYQPSDIINLIFSYYRYDPISTVEDTPTSRLLNVNLNSNILMMQKTFGYFNFLKRVVQLTTPFQPNLHPSFNYTYVLPSDFNKIYEVDDYQGKWLLREPYILMENSNKWLNYYCYSLDYNSFPVHFAELLACYIAKKYAIYITREPEIEKALDITLANLAQDVFQTELQNLSPLQNSYIPNHVMQVA